MADWISLSELLLWDFWYLILCWGLHCKENKQNEKSKLFESHQLLFIFIIFEIDYQVNWPARHKIENLFLFLKFYSLLDLWEIKRTKKLLFDYDLWVSSPLVFSYLWLSHDPWQSFWWQLPEIPSLKIKKQKQKV